LLEGDSVIFIKEKNPVLFVLIVLE